MYRQITSACGKACVLAMAGISLHLPLIAVLGAVVPCHSQQGRHESAQDRGDFGMEFATFLAIIVLILVELLRCCWSCLRCTTATHFAKGSKELEKLQAENQDLQEEVAQLSNELQAMKKRPSASSSSKSHERRANLPERVFVAKDSPVFHVNCFHLKRASAHFTTLRLCHDCARCE